MCYFLYFLLPFIKLISIFHPYLPFIFFSRTAGRYVVDLHTFFAFGYKNSKIRHGHLASTIITTTPPITYQVPLIGGSWNYGVCGVFTFGFAQMLITFCQTFRAGGVGKNGSTVAVSFYLRSPQHKTRLG